jgi:hypothetical protein
MTRSIYFWYIICYSSNIIRTHTGMPEDIFYSFLKLYDAGELLTGNLHLHLYEHSWNRSNSILQVSRTKFKRGVLCNVKLNNLMQSITNIPLVNSPCLSYNSCVATSQQHNIMHYLVKVHVYMFHTFFQHRIHTALSTILKVVVQWLQQYTVDWTHTSASVHSFYLPHAVTHNQHMCTNMYLQANWVSFHHNTVSATDTVNQLHHVYRDVCMSASGV